MDSFYTFTANVTHAHSTGRLIKQGLPSFYSLSTHSTYKYLPYIKATCLPPDAVTKRLQWGLLLLDRNSA